ncbi:MAG: hypothetical protein QM706_12260 [Nitrospira sp.]
MNNIGELQVLIVDDHALIRREIRSMLEGNEEIQILGEASKPKVKMLQTTVLREGILNALVFIATVIGVHQLLALACVRSTRIRRIVRSGPRLLIKNAKVDYEALAS